jgi:hypothetical protein
LKQGALSKNAAEKIIGYVKKEREDLGYRKNYLKNKLN